MLLVYNSCNRMDRLGWLAAIGVFDASAAIGTLWPGVQRPSPEHKDSRWVTLKANPRQQ